ncbi:MAG: F0F1 ATP synthase subunit alpha [Mycoplasmoidaceae bacterium]
MSVNVDRFSLAIKNQIKKYSEPSILTEFGKIISVGDGIVEIAGLSGVMLNEVLIFENGTYGLALNLESEIVGAISLGHFFDLKEGSIVKRTNHLLRVPVGDELLGRVVNALGEAIDEKGSIKSKKTLPIERVALGVMTRESVNEPLETGILAIDSMFPIGKGQRELIIGDRQTGKTTIAIDTIINQKGKKVKCVYVAIGQKNSTIALIKRTLEKNGAMAYTTIVSSSASDLPSLKYIAPFSGTAIAEYWMENGEDVLIIYDDLTKHAISYRTLSLLLRRPPGREAYPGDVFYLHSRLLERSSKLNKEYGGGSITALPIIETQLGDISAYIPTNVISITDGQLFLMANIFNSGQRPAIDAGLSVSRVGSAAQINLIKKLSGNLKIDLAQYRELESFSQFGSDLDSETKRILDHGKKVMEIIKQPQASPYSQIDEAILLFIIKHKLIRWIPVDNIIEFKNLLLSNLKSKACYTKLTKTMIMDDKLEKEFIIEIKEFIKKYVLKIKNYNWDLYPPLEVA